MYQIIQFTNCPLWKVNALKSMQWRKTRMIYAIHNYKRLLPSNSQTQKSLKLKYNLITHSKSVVQVGLQHQLTNCFLHHAICCYYASLSSSTSFENASSLRTTEVDRNLTGEGAALKLLLELFENWTNQNSDKMQGDYINKAQRLKIRYYA